MLFGSIIIFVVWAIALTLLLFLLPPFCLSFSARKYRESRLLPGGGGATREHYFPLIFRFFFVTVFGVLQLLLAVLVSL